MASKVQFNLKNVHYAPITTTGTYGTPVAIPGGVNLTADPSGDEYIFWADGTRYYVSHGSGYEGTLEVAKIPDAFRTAILGDVLDSNNVLVEVENPATVNFALGFQIDGDDESTYFWYYNCTATRPSQNAATTEEDKEVQTETLDWSCAPGTNGYVRAKTTSTTGSTETAGWFTSVYAPSIANG